MNAYAARLISTLFALFCLFTLSSSAFADESSELASDSTEIEASAVKTCVDLDPTYIAPHNPGFYMDMGVGMGDIFNHTGVIHLGAGIVWDLEISDNIRFGTYLDINVGAPAFFNMGSVALNIMPKFHFTRKNFQFSLGLGVGFELWGDDGYDPADEYSKPADPSIAAFLSIKPNLEFDWFLTTAVPQLFRTAQVVEF